MKNHEFNRVGAYCVYDRKGNIYNNPYFLSNDMVAIRQLDMMVKNPETMISKYPEDYVLYKVGLFDLLTGELLPLKKEMIMEANNLIKKGGK